MLKLKDIIRRTGIDGDVGIEVELEATTPLPEVTGPWKGVVDHSLRGNSLEYITRQPVRINAVPAVVEELFEKLPVNKLILSDRTSTHVHVNVLDFSVRELYNAITICWLLEPYLLRQVKEHRRHSAYSLPLSLSDYVLDLMQHDLANKTFFVNFTVRSAKYCATALHHILDLGTIEFRSKEGSKDPADIIKWTQTVHKIVNLVRTKPNAFGKTPIDILNFAAKNPDAFFELTEFSYPEKELYSQILIMYERLYGNWESHFKSIENRFKAKVPPGAEIRGLNADQIILHELFQQPRI